MNKDPNADLVGFEFFSKSDGLRLRVTGSWPANSQYVVCEWFTRADKPSVIRPASAVRRRKELEAAA